MSKVLSYRGYNVCKNDISQELLEKIKEQLTVAPNIFDNFNSVKPIPFKLYQESSSRIYMPKFYGIKTFGVPDIIKLHDGININTEFNGTLRPYQEEAAVKFLEAARNPQKMGGIINVHCGWGKTNLAIYIMCALKKKTLIVCHKDFLLQQWKERIEQFTTGAKIGMLKAKIIDIENKDIVLASLQSLSMKDYPEDTFNTFGFFIADECHHFPAEVFSRALKKVNFKYALGLSATLNRKDGLTKVLKWHIGNVVFKAAKRTDELQVHFCDFYDPNPKYSLEVKGYNNKLNVSRMINNICEYEPRTNFIIQKLIEVLVKEPERRVIILSDRRNHLECFHALLSQKGYESAFYVGGMRQEELKRSEAKQIILATYHIAAEGFDCPGLDTLILASPKSDVIQCVGRIQRTPQHLRKHVPLVLDIVDNFSLFQRQAKKRYAYYKSCDYITQGDDIFQQQTNKIELDGICYIQCEDNE
jgi:superfamily II DNA or RNA helicase